MMRVLKNTWFWFFLTVAVAASAFFWLVAQQPALPSLEGQSESRPGSIEVLTSPTGAQITLDGKALDQTTPATIDGVSPGKHTIKLSESGFHEATLTVTATPGKVVSAQVELMAQ
jgi:hypothetical protein